MPPDCSVIAVRVPAGGSHVRPLPLLCEPPPDEPCEEERVRPWYAPCAAGAPVAVGVGARPLTGLPCRCGHALAMCPGFLQMLHVCGCLQSARRWSSAPQV